MSDTNINKKSHFHIDIYGYRIYNDYKQIYGSRIQGGIMDDYNLRLDNIADGILVEKTDLEEVDAGRKKRMYASAAAYIRNQTGMNKKEFAEYLGIPYRTLQDWELGNTQAPEYVLRLIAYKVMWEKERGNL